MKYALALILLLSGCGLRSTTTAPAPEYDGPPRTTAELQERLAQAELLKEWYKSEAENAEAEAAKRERDHEKALADERHARELAIEQAKTEAETEKATAVTRAKRDHENTAKTTTGWAIGAMSAIGVGLFVASFFVPFIRKKDAIGIWCGAGALIIARSMLVRFGFDFAAWAFWILLVVGVVVGLLIGLAWVRRVFLKEADKLEENDHPAEATAIRATVKRADKAKRRAMLIEAGGTPKAMLAAAKGAQ